MNPVIVELPCNVGDTVYILADIHERRKKPRTEIVEGKVDHFTIGQSGIPMASICKGDSWELAAPGEFYLTKEAAEEALGKEKYENEIFDYGRN